MADPKEDKARRENPTIPPTATPGKAQPDQQPVNQAAAKDDKPEEKTIAKDEAKTLFEAGTKLKKKGDPPEKWFMASRVQGQLCMVKPLSEEDEKKELEGDLVIAE